MKFKKWYLNFLFILSLLYYSYILLFLKPNVDKLSNCLPPGKIVYNFVPLIDEKSTDVINNFVKIFKEEQRYRNYYYMFNEIIRKMKLDIYKKLLLLNEDNMKESKSEKDIVNYLEIFNRKANLKNLDIHFNLLHRLNIIIERVTIDLIKNNRVSPKLSELPAKVPRILQAEYKDLQSYIFERNIKQEKVRNEIFYEIVIEECAKNNIELDVEETLINLSYTENTISSIEQYNKYKKLSRYIIISL